ncbi:putative bifunctional diguanylate cyclase/phosphodiesterase [Sphingomonas sp. PAMC 26621]|uniref:putative bifunctional diguanylate cyclase/phosphodiesterase n=1 Tax=Sphingomonas sp. PAMC 26621 TaxID=1112213 RepID=UPI0002884977|nr:EAL domain-containing protein [Sphingomonas sp. PAMC 26621]
MPFSRTIPKNDQPLVVAKILHFRRQAPWMYALLSINAAALAYSHIGYAPRILTHAIPAMLVLLALWRVIAWVLPPGAAMLTEAGAARKIRQTTVLGAFFAIAFVTWALCLARYGGPYQQGHVVVFIGTTVLGCLFCLTHLPAAATAVGVLVNVPFLLYSALNGNTVFTAVALNIALVTAVFLIVLRDAHQIFENLVASRNALVAERQQAQRLSDENRALAHTDSLTGLPNRRYFFGALETLLASRQGAASPVPPAPFCVGVLDLDRFKAINDTYGHVCGDRLLGAIGARLAADTHAPMTVARLGGDEFGVLYDGPPEQAEPAIRHLCESIHRPIAIDGLEVTLGCSAGIAVYPEAGTTAHALFDRSDYALYHVKAHQRGGCAVFSHEQEALIRVEQRVEAALQVACLERELEVHFQPIFDTRTMTVSSVEALARWKSPVLGEVPPETMIAAAERLGIINAVTLTLFARALESLAVLPDPISLSFNLSAQDLMSRTTMREIVRMILATNISPKRIIFEVTETSLVTDMATAREALERVRSVGVRTALDDFGTGYSSLGSLQELPLDILKIDRTFVNGMATGTGRSMVAAIRNLAQSLSLDCTMEGIETESQLIEVSLAGYRYAQGYLLGRPMPIDALLMTLRDHHVQLPDPAPRSLSAVRIG